MEDERSAMFSESRFRVRGVAHGRPHPFKSDVHHGSAKVTWAALALVALGSFPSSSAKHSPATTEYWSEFG